MWINLSLLINFLLIINTINVLCNTNNIDFNPYKVLGLSTRANEKDIKKAYKQLAKQWHPDKNKSPEANEKFVQINQAYEVE